ncbi:serine/threonine-protein kinase CTR1 [Pelomyxa schiedti]|nr:serine/threonine-protein kinase CTR1 [Pelomyxa schiedti]
MQTQQHQRDQNIQGQQQQIQMQVQPQNLSQQLQDLYRDLWIQPESLPNPHGRGFLGAGAYSTVYTESLGVTNVAVKEHKEVADFIQEISILRMLRHPNIVLLMGCSVSGDGHALLVMERMDTNLDLLIHQPWSVPEEMRGSMLLRRKLDIALQVVSGLDHTHRSDIVQRDLKPANILLDRKGNVKVSGWGCSCSLANGPVASNPNIGTWQYMPPENYGSALVSKAYDIYSLGLILWELYTEMELWSMKVVRERMSKIPPDAPEAKMTPQEVLLMMIVCEEYRPNIPDLMPHKRDPTQAEQVTPPALRELITLCWAADPIKRLSISEVNLRLKAIIADLP